uniref:ABC transporter domain-containing protein n=1 Tax=Heterosigma akashiwo TaxID=2829 RepID=A0A7S3XS93_HETAK
MAMFYSWQMSLATLGTIIPMSIGGVIEMQAAQGVALDSNKAQEGGEAGATVASAVVGVRTVHAFGMNEAVLGDYRVILEKKMKSDAKKSSIAGIALGYSQGVPMFVYAFLFWLGAYLVNQGDLNFEDMLAALFCLISVSFSMGDAAGLAGDQAAAKKAVARCFGLLDLAEEREPAGGEGARPAECAGALEFADLKFAYPERPDAQVYDGFSLSVGAGQTVALCGPSGGGKSTCMALLLGFYRPLAGSITLDGRDIRDLDLRWLRAQIGYVGQEPVLFSGTIRSNIVYSVGNGDETIHSGGGGEHHDKVVHAAKAAKAHEFVMQLKGGYDADVGEKSMLISGGQKQRLAIARAIMKSPKVLLLDEATSALDNENEKLVQAALDNLQRGGRFTTLVIAHRLSTIQNADAIAVIESGHIVEMGTDAELMNRENGSYKALKLAAGKWGDGATSNNNMSL